MRILTDCPVVLGEWRLCSREAVRMDAAEADASQIWRAFGGNGSPWIMEPDVDQQPDVVLLVVENSDQSQFDRLVELVRSEADLPETLVCMALEGENFHGQSERPWTAVRGNLHLSMYSKLDIPAADLQEEISILPTLSLLDAFGIRANADEHTGIRWLNDLFVKGRKVAGTIAASQIEGDRIEGVIYGIGVNVESVPDVNPSPCVPAAASLRSTMPEVGWTVGGAAIALINSLQKRLEELKGGIGEQLSGVYASYSACIGQDVRVWPKKVDDFAATEPLAVGKLLTIGGDLSLIVEGHSEAIRNGRLAFEADCRELGL
jgi:BirA family transcriptional regulator, biotin operon repressor / biotin---[acetyl-CoA-carboxylase] ligase